MKIKINEKGKKRILKHHPWVFKSDLMDEKIGLAEIVEIIGPKNEPIAQGFYSPHSQISLRIIANCSAKIDERFWEERILSADQFRKTLHIPSNAYRMIYGESDGIPSFILDRYDNAFSFQILSAGLETIRETILKIIRKNFHPDLIVERNDVTVRNFEKLPLSSQIIEGSKNSKIIIEEDPLKFEVDLLEGQKTGAFLDQRSNRILAGKMAENRKKALDVFSYQGWFACHIAKKAENVIAIEQSEISCQQIKINAELNALKNISISSSNAFDYLREADQSKKKFDLINLDPPAFAKSKSHLFQALKGYKEINLRAMKLLEKDGILITSSCSHHISDEQFLEIITEAAHDAKRQVQIIRIGHQAPDHPILVGFPESNYLKSLFLKMM